MPTTEEIRDRAFREVKGIPPARVKAVRRKQGKEAANRITAAIALDLARKRGAKIPKE